MTTTTDRVLVIAAHPEDPDFLAGGTVARLAREGREVACVILRVTGRVVLDSRVRAAQRS